MRDVVSHCGDAHRVGLAFPPVLQRNVKTVKAQKKAANLPLRRYAVKA